MSRPIGTISQSGSVRNFTRFVYNSMMYMQQLATQWECGKKCQQMAKMHEVLTEARKAKGNENLFEEFSKDKA